MADNKDKKVLNVPALRFPEFTDEWKRIKVSDLLDFYSTNSLSWEQLEYEPNEPYNLHYGLIHVGLPTLIDLTKDKLPSIKNGNVPKKYELCKEGDVAFADASEDTNEVAKVVEFYNLGGKKVVCGLHTIHGRNNNGQTAKGFLGYCFSSTVFHNQIRRIAQGTKIYSINTRNFSEVFVGLPRRREQQKIATLLRLIDERIATQNKIIEKLETLIKGIIETVISSQKPNTLIKNCLECNSSTLQESQVAETGTFPVYGATGISGYTEAPDVNGESILIIKDGSGVGTVKYVTGEYSYIGTLNSLTAKDGYCLKFIYFALQKFCFEPYKTGMAIPHIYFKDYGKAKIFCPTIKEQFAIAKRISMVEDKVSVEKRIFFHYQAQKSYLLSQMLI
ncbi:restriction endonuclease subunit S [Odoribacter splanchnicus]|uniref:restriction endonuclease subunit S n=1 Tax=Odoribacter splanchnicus TaxID=28118 RepID=UPI00233131F4|nr:restriction endonuclease subunit S [Odoribacter splanchnicus]MDB9202129.1 restriction endonuclease subunit S [Odoribacter splanchnicus]